MRLFLPACIAPQPESDVAQIAYGDIDGGEEVDVELDLVFGSGDADGERDNVTHATSGLMFGESPWRLSPETCPQLVNDPLPLPAPGCLARV